MIKNYTLCWRDVHWCEAAKLLACIAAAHPNYKIFNIQWIERNSCSDLYINITATADEINNILKTQVRFEIFDEWEKKY